MSRVSLHKATIEWALARSRQKVADLRKKFPKIDEWISGQSNPTLKQLESLARVTSTPLGFLLLKAPPVISLPVPHYRTLKADEPAEPTPELFDTIQLMEKRQDWLREYLKDQGSDTLPLVASCKMSESTVLIAEKIRKALGIPHDWASAYRTWSDAFRGLRELSEDVGIVVVVNGIVGNNTKRKLSVDEFRGFVLVDSLCPLVFINGADGKSAQMFTLAHELSHLFLGVSAAFDLRNLEPSNEPIEKKCNEIAAELLVPAVQLTSMWPSLKNEHDPFQAIARHFKVSTIVGARRLLDLKLISRNKFFEFYKEYLAKEKKTKTSSGGDFYATQDLRVGRRFGENVVQAVREGKLLYNEAYRLTGLYGETFAKFAGFDEAKRA